MQRALHIFPTDKKSVRYPRDNCYKFLNLIYIHIYINLHYTFRRDSWCVWSNAVGPR